MAQMSWSGCFLKAIGSLTFVAGVILTSIHGAEVPYLLLLGLGFLLIIVSK